MQAPTDLEIARQLDFLWGRINQGIKKADGILKQAKQVGTEISRVEAVQLEITELVAQSRLQIQEMQQLSASVEQFHNQVVLAIQEIGGQETLAALQKEIYNARNKLKESTLQIQQAEKRLHTFETQLQKRLAAFEEIISQVKKEKMAVANLVEKAEDKVHQVMQVQLELQQFHQNTTYNLEELRSEVANLAQEVRADKEAIENLNTDDAIRVNALSVLVHQQSKEIERLNQQLLNSQGDMGQRLQVMIQNQQRLRNWLLAVTFGIAFALALAVASLGWQ